MVPCGRQEPDSRARARTRRGEAIWGSRGSFQSLENGRDVGDPKNSRNPRRVSVCFGSKAVVRVSSLAPFRDGGIRASNTGGACPSARFEQPQSMRLRLVSGFFADSIQQIHSLRASGLISSQVASASGRSFSASCRSPGSSWNDAPGDVGFGIHTALSQRSCGFATGGKRTLAMRLIRRCRISSPRRRFHRNRRASAH